MAFIRFEWTEYFFVFAKTAMKSHRLSHKWEMAAAEVPSVDRGCTSN